MNNGDEEEKGEDNNNAQPNSIQPSLVVDQFGFVNKSSIFQAIQLEGGYLYNENVNNNFV